MVRLFGSHPSPYVRHCGVALDQEGIDFDFVETDSAASARQSPAQRVPFLQAGELSLTDSTSILRWVREQGGGSLLVDLAAFDRYLLVNTAMDATVNLFLLELDGLTPGQVPYLARQRDRVQSCLEALEALFQGVSPEDDDGLRLACYLSWASFRERLDHGPYPTLGRVRAHWEGQAQFADTHPSKAC